MKKVITVLLLVAFLSTAICPAFAGIENQTIYLTEVGHGEFKLDNARNVNAIQVEKYTDTIYKAISSENSRNLKHDYFIREDNTFLMAEKIVIDTKNKAEVQAVIEENYLDEDLASLLLDETTENEVILFSTASPTNLAYSERDGYYYRITEAYLYGTAEYEVILRGDEIKTKYLEDIYYAVGVGIGAILDWITMGGWTVLEIFGAQALPDPLDIHYNDLIQVKLDEAKTRRVCYMSTVEANPEYWPIKAAAEMADVTYIYDVYAQAEHQTTHPRTYDTIYSDHYYSLVDLAIEYYYQLLPGLDYIKQYKVENVIFTISY